MKQMDMLHSEPKTAAEAAVLARARQLTDFTWTPLRDVPTYTRTAGQTVLPAGVEVKGFPYSSTERTDKFFAENVSFETFLSAIANPHSKLYQPGHGAFGTCNYGIVCNGLVRYALGIRRRVPTFRWYTIPGMREVKPKGEYGLNELQLCDVLHACGEGVNHVALITDILTGEDGEIAAVEVSEAVRPSCKRALYTPEEFFERFKLYGLCRYDKLEEVPLFDTESDKVLFESGIEKVTPKITVDNGNKSNYLVGEEVLISVFGEASDTLELFRNGELIKSLPVGSRAMFPLEPERGYYVARLQQAGDSVEFCVNQAELHHQVCGDMITVYADPCDEQSRILYADFRQEGEREAGMETYEELTEEEIETHKYSRPIPPDGKNFKVYFQNAYGVWTHPMRRI